MNLPEICIKRPVLASMLSLTLVLFGVVGLLRLPVRELPDIDPPVVTVTTVYPGANASVVESEVTERLEDVINGVEGIKKMTSESREQVSNITVEFNLARDIDLSAQDVRDRVSRIRGALPDGIDEPIIAKQDADARPMLWVALYSDRHSPLELSDIAEEKIQDRLATVPGVSSVILGGVKRYAIRIRLNSEKMAARQVTVLDIEKALKEQNVELPSGRVENLSREMTIQTYGEMKNPEEFNQMVIRRDKAALIRLSDVGYAEVGVEDERTVARYNSKTALGLGVVRQAKANAISVAKGIKDKVEFLKSSLPEGVETFIAYDESVYVEDAIREVWFTLFVAFILVVLTIFLFLGNLRSTLVPTITIPISLIGVFSILNYFGYSINILSMLALVLAIGIVVDDSIVVLENIYRHIEEGKPPMEAAFMAMKEIMFAVIVTTVALVAVFLPLTFQTSITGRLFVEFAMTLSGAVVISTFVALSMTPMAASRILRKHDPTMKEGPFNQMREAALNWISVHYLKWLHWCISNKKKVAFAGLIISFAGIGIYLTLDQEFLPEEDKGRLFSIAIAPEGSTSEYTDRMVSQMEGIIKSVPETAGYFSAVALAFSGPGNASQGLMFVRFKSERNRSLQDVMAGPRGLGSRFFSEVEGAIAIPIMPKAISRGFGQPFQLTLQNPDLKRLNAVSTEISGKLREMGIFRNVRSQFSLTKPELGLHIDRNRTASLGVSIEDISKTLQILFGGLDLSSVKRNGKEYDVIVQLERESRLKPSDLNRLYVRNKDGQLIQLTSIVSYSESAAPNAIYRLNRQRSATIEATPMGIPLGNAMETVQKMLKKSLPKDFSYEWSGEASDLRETSSESTFILILAILIIYITLAAQFESLLHPFTVMVALPLGIVGGLGLLWILNLVNILGQMLYGWANYSPDPPMIASILSSVIPRIPAMNINLFSLVGFLLLMGMVTKNSILLVEFANQKMEEGLDAAHAILEAGHLRLRPILMTATATITGILPIAIGFGAGAESRRAMGVAIVGGMIFSTLLTLFIVPVVYVLMDRLASNIKLKLRGKTVLKTVMMILLPFFLFSSQANSEPLQSKPLSLNEALSVAVKNNFQIRKAKERIENQHGAVLEARSKILPNVHLTGSYQRVDENKLPKLNGAKVGSDESWTARAEVTQALFLGGQGWADSRRARFLREAATEDFKAVVNDMMLSVREQYYTVLLNLAKVNVQRKEVELLEHELESEKKKREAGLVSDFNVLRTEVALANSKAPFIRAKNEVTLALQDLRRLLGISAEDSNPMDHVIQVEGELKYIPFEMNLTQSIDEALKMRPEIASLDKSVLAEKHSVYEGWSEFFPSVRAFGAYEGESSRFGTNVDTIDKGWVAGLRGEWRFFNSFASRGRLTKAKSALAQTKIQLEEARFNVEMDVRRAHSSLEEADERVKASRKVVEIAEESLRLAQSRFRAGVSTQLDLLTTQVSLTEARTNEVQALYDYNVVLARLKRSLGQFVQ